MTNLQKYCCHKWVVYTGLMTSFEHCETCGLKKSEYYEIKRDKDDPSKPYGFTTDGESIPYTIPKSIKAWHEIWDAHNNNNLGAPLLEDMKQAFNNCGAYDPNTILGIGTHEFF